MNSHTGTPPPPVCPDGHGPMERTPGFWCLNGTNRMPVGLLGDAHFVPNNQGFIVKVWSCPACGQVRIFADDKPDQDGA